MNLYEIINHSDPLTMKAPNLRIAAMAVCAISERFGVRGPDGKSPVWFGWDEWFPAHGITDIPSFIDANQVAIADALASVMLGKPADRADLDDMLASLPDDEARRAFIARRNNRHRSSLNDIEAAAHRMSQLMRAGPKTQEGPA